MKIETIIEPNEHIQEIATHYLGVVRQILPNRQVELVGGMAVPMVGRPELDILVITDDIEGDTCKLEEAGFKYRGVGDKAFYLKQQVEGVEVTTQIMGEDHKMVKIHRGLIELLRKNVVLREQYEEFKRTLAGLNRDEYKRKKTEFLEKYILPNLI